MTAPPQVYGFDNDGQPVPLAFPDERETLVDLLVCGGLDLATADRLAPMLEKHAEQLALDRMADVLRSIARRLDRTPAGRALERVLLGDGGQSLADDAEQVGCSKQLLQHHEKRIRDKLNI